MKNLDKVWDSLPHSVESTLLLDDSILKAHMQPYNHLILKEYDKDLRYNPVEDQTLLAIIGILSDAIHESNVASWIRFGGLRPSSEPEVRQAPGELPNSANGEDPLATGVSCWYDDPRVFSEWVARGRAELERLNIPIE